MASPTTPQHGKQGSIYRLRPSGFVGNGLNDLSWGTGYSGGGSSARFAVEIDGTGTPDTFRWNKDGGGWTSAVSITGGAQTLSDSQTITFAATTGHTVGDAWQIGNYDTEPTTESGSQAQVTDTTRRQMNPNATIVWTDSNGEKVEKTDFTSGIGYFSGAVGIVSVAGNNGFIPDGAIELVGYAFDWSLEATLEMADISRFQTHYKEFLPGQAEIEVEASSYFIGCDTWYDSFQDNIDGTQSMHLLELFTYDPNGDGTGEVFRVWGGISKMSWSAPIGDVVKEVIGFKPTGIMSRASAT